MTNGKPDASDGSYGRDVVTLNLPGKQLGTFLASMLGERRTLTKDFDTRFTADLNWLLNLFHLIDQRIESQNDASLVKVSAHCLFENGKRVELSGKDQLLSYRDVSDDISNGFRLVISYLIKFPYKDQPETQEITFYTFAGRDPATLKESPSHIRMLLIPLSTDRSIMRLDVRHTDISWAEDITNLVSNHVSAAFKARHRIINSIIVVLATFAPIIAMVMGVLAITFMESGGKDIKLQFLSDVSPLFKSVGGDIPTIERKINALYEYSLVQEKSRSPWMMMLTFLPLMCLLPLSLVVARLRPASYVVLNARTERFALENERKRRRLSALVLTGFLLSVGTGVLSNVIYTRLPG